MKQLLLTTFIALFIFGCNSGDSSSGGGDSSNNNSANPDSSTQKDVKLFFSDYLSSENSTIQPYSDWYLSKDEEETTLDSEYKERNRRAVAVIKLNAVASQKQFWIFTEETK
ncbi:MAG: hypothetical protein OIF32_04550 [Campylobacterales bacterium]|nr:hypothetical protein [Campylobacterales bacterium]